MFLFPFISEELKLTVRTAQELSLAQDAELERNLEVGPDSELAENVTPTDSAQKK